MFDIVVHFHLCLVLPSPECVLRRFESTEAVTLEQTALPSSGRRSSHYRNLVSTGQPPNGPTAKCGRWIGLAIRWRYCFALALSGEACLCYLNVVPAGWAMQRGFTLTDLCPLVLFRDCQSGFIYHSLAIRPSLSNFHTTPFR